MNIKIFFVLAAFMILPLLARSTEISYLNSEGQSINKLYNKDINQLSFEAYQDIHSIHVPADHWLLNNIGENNPFFNLSDNLLLPDLCIWQNKFTYEAIADDRVLLKKTDEACLKPDRTSLPMEKMQLDQHFEFTGKLGKGSFAFVDKYRFTDNGKEYAVKFAKKHHKNPVDLMDEFYDLNIAYFTNAVIGVYAFGEVKIDDHLQSFIIMELAKNDLNKIIESGSSIDIQYVIDAAKRFVFLLDFIYSDEGFRKKYRDIKPANILLSKKRGLVLTDFSTENGYTNGYRDSSRGFLFADVLAHGYFGERLTPLVQNDGKIRTMRKDNLKVRKHKKNVDRDISPLALKCITERHFGRAKGEEFRGFCEYPNRYKSFNSLFQFSISEKLLAPIAEEEEVEYQNSLQELVQVLNELVDRGAEHALSEASQPSLVEELKNTGRQRSSLKWNPGTPESPSRLKPAMNIRRVSDQ